MRGKVEELWLMSAKEVMPNVIVGKYLMPKKVVIFSTSWDVARGRAEGMRTVFEKEGINVQVVEIPAFDAQKIVSHLEDLKKSSEMSKVVFLANSSTKYTVKVIDSWLEKNGGMSIYYLHDGRVLRFGGEHLFTIKDNVLKPTDFSDVVGINITNKNVLFDEIPEDTKRNLIDFYKRLIKDELFCANVNNRDKIRPLIRKERRLLKSYRKYIYRSKKGNFANSGFCLEFLTYETLKSAGVFKYILANLEIVWKNSTRNEIDILAVRKNRLFYFSCKKRKKLVSDEHLHRVSLLARQIGGRYAVPILVTCSRKKIANNVVRSMALKARNLGVNMIDIRQLIKFPQKPYEFLKRWENLIV